MHKKVYVSIIGTSTIGEDSDSTELVTEGEYTQRNGKYLLKYRENLSDTGGDCATIIKIDKETVTMTRSGEANTQMIFEKGKRHMSHYETPIGSFTIGVSTDNLDVCVDDDGGNVEIKYVLDINNSANVKNYLKLNIRGERF